MEITQLKIDSLIIKNLSEVNYIINQRAVIKSKQIKILILFKNLFKSIEKNNILYYIRLYKHIFDYWKGIVNEEKQRVNEEILLLIADNKEVEGKIHKYNQICNRLDEEEDIINCGVGCKRNTQIEDYSNTYTYIKDETLNNINHIPQFYSNEGIDLIDKFERMTFNNEDESGNDNQDFNEMNEYNDENIIDYSCLLRNIDTSKLSK